MEARPNLFKYATSELSQDAFLLWLLEWANPENAKYDLALHSTAVGFVRLLLGDDSLEVKSVCCYKQFNHIDVLAIVNDSVAIIIEDKVNAKEHGNQIARYKESLKSSLNVSGNARNDIRCIYLKTGNESRNLLKAIEDDGSLKRIWRPTLLSVLERCESQNVILRDFAMRLRELEDATNRYRILPFTEWDYTAWQGFYLWLEQKRADAGWHYVSNASGGFLAFFWHWRNAISSLGYTTYLQIEQGKICIKGYREPEKISTAEIFKCRKKIADVAPRFGINAEFTHLRSGRYVTICASQMDEFFNDSLFDETKFLNRLASFERLVDEVSK